MLSNSLPNNNTPLDYPVQEITIGFHPEGFRIDKSADPLNRYTRWSTDPDGSWKDPEPVCFHSLPESGWIKTDRFDWNLPCWHPDRTEK